MPDLTAPRWPKAGRSPPPARRVGRPISERRKATARKATKGRPWTPAAPFPTGPADVDREVARWSAWAAGHGAVCEVGARSALRGTGDIGGSRPGCAIRP